MSAHSREPVVKQRADRLREDLPANDHAVSQCSLLVRHVGMPSVTNESKGFHVRGEGLVEWLSHGDGG